MSECQLTVGPFFQCCCKCVFHLQEYHRCTLENHEKGLCFKPKPDKWVCAPPELNGVFTDWPEHSCGCELYTTEETLKKEEERAMEDLPSTLG
jgi:hypothetical protein